MFQKILLIAFWGMCYGSIFDQSLKFQPFRKGVHRFAMDLPQEAEKLESKVDGSKAQGELLEKLRGAILLRGQPLGGVNPNALLPLFGLGKPSNQRTASNGKRIMLKSYSFRNCTNPPSDKTTFVVRKLMVQPDPLEIPGKLQISFNLNLKQTFTNLTINLDFYKKVGTTYIRIPCIGEFGSCFYDVCQELEQVQPGTCPQELVKQKINCKCPFNKGVYNVPNVIADIEVPVFPNGDYKINATMASHGTFVGCYAGLFTIA